MIYSQVGRNTTRFGTSGKLSKLPASGGLEGLTDPGRYLAQGITPDEAKQVAIIRADIFIIARPQAESYPVVMTFYALWSNAAFEEPGQLGESGCISTSRALRHVY